MSKESNSGGLGLGTILFIVFLILKIANVIDWSWWWVTSPLWIPLVIVGLIALILVIYEHINR